MKDVRIACRNGRLTVEVRSGLEHLLCTPGLKVVKPRTASGRADERLLHEICVRAAYRVVEWAPGFPFGGLLFGRLIRALRARPFYQGFHGACLRHNAALLVISGHTPLSVSLDDVRRYLAMVSSRSGKAACQKALEAVCFYYGTVLGRAFVRLLPPVRKAERQMRILSRFEVFAILAVPASLKHRALLELSYSAGLKAAEAVKVRSADLNCAQGIVMIEGKPRPLLEETLNVLKLYCDRPGQGEWLFGGQKGQKPMTARAAELIFQKARAAAGVEGGFAYTALRHSRAAHMLEDGVSIREIESRLGYASSTRRP